MAEAYIVDAVRTAGGKRKGALTDWHPADMAGEVLNALTDRNPSLDPAAIDDVIMGCVSQGGEQAFAFGRNAVLASRLPQSVPSVTIDRQCGSSQQAVQFAAQAVMSGTQDIVIAAGGESMTRVPMGSNYALYQQAGVGVGPFSKRIQNRFGVPMFSQFQGAEMIARKYGFSRDVLDQFALESHQKAAAAIAAGAFANEIVPLAVDGGTHTIDEGVRMDATLEGIGSVKLLAEGGVISAANASQMCDGASGALIVSERALKQFGLTPMARIHTMTVTAGDPVIMLEEPIPATAKALARAGLTIDDIDLFEVNEAFASVPLAWLQATGADPRETERQWRRDSFGPSVGRVGHEADGDDAPRSSRTRQEIRTANHV